MTDPDSDSETCGIIIIDLFISGSDGYVEGHCECLRSCGHDGPHLIQREGGGYVIWETDLSCDCETCQISNDSYDWCNVYRSASAEEAALLVCTKEVGIVLISYGKKR